MAVFNPVWLIMVDVREANYNFYFVDAVLWKHIKEPDPPNPEEYREWVTYLVGLVDDKPEDCPDKAGEVIESFMLSEYIDCSFDVPFNICGILCL